MAIRVAHETSKDKIKQNQKDADKLMSGLTNGKVAALMPYVRLSALLASMTESELIARFTALDVDTVDDTRNILRGASLAFRLLGKLCDKGFVRFAVATKDQWRKQEAAKRVAKKREPKRRVMH